MKDNPVHHHKWPSSGSKSPLSLTTSSTPHHYIKPALSTSFWPTRSSEPRSTLPSPSCWTVARSARVSIAFLLIIITTVLSPSDCEPSKISPANVHDWAQRFGKDIYEGSADATCFRKIETNYREMKASATNVGCDDQVRSMAEMVSNMFAWKKTSAWKIAAKAEKEAQNAAQDVGGELSYLNAKTFTNGSITDESGQKVANLVPSSVFRNVLVDHNNTAVHIPTNVYEETQELKDAIRWSGALWTTFHSNAQNDSDLNWQFFCSSKGLLRYYPAAQWRYPQFLSHPEPSDSPLDLYDCRMREWYVKAAASPKDVVILLDGSGSMTGQRKEIAKNVVANILDTLTDDDYVTVIRFSDNLEPVVKCFNESLVEANKQNIQLFKESLHELNTTDIADFRGALVRAFEVLQEAFRSSHGSLCNQAIMLVTDGAPDTYREIFERYNYPRISIRVFTYLVGKEVTETKEINLMACENRGYYTQISSLSEIREQVQLYLPVMSRPLVLSQHRVFRFTGVYADITDVPLTPWVWDEREREKIRRQLQIRRIREASSQVYNGREPSGSYGEVTDQEEEDESQDHTEEWDTSGEDEEISAESAAHLNDSESVPLLANSRISHQSVEVNRSAIHPSKTAKGPPKSRPKRQLPRTPPRLPTTASLARKTEKKGVHELMTTLSLPVFDVKNFTNVTERFMHKNVWKERTKEVRSANLLGVVGVDVPIREIVRRTPAYKIGVNGYSFAINNNGHILFHPDLRPLFQDLLKPFYSSVDLLEVEIPNVEHGPREYNQALLEFRNGMIRSTAAKLSDFEVKMHIDAMKRAVTRRNSYCSMPIAGTPFSLALVLPQPYGGYRVTGEIEIKRRDENYLHYFRGNNWRVHPDWVYCDSERLKRDNFSSPEESVLHFLNLAATNESSIWYSEPSRLPPIKSRTTCEKELVKSLVFDAKATDIGAKRCGGDLNPANIDPLGLLLALLPRDQLTQLFGITLTFVATRSGLTRFEDHRPPEERGNGPDDPESDFIETHTRAIDELYYQRAVDFYRNNTSGFLFSVPFNAGEKSKPIYVTGSRAIFVGQGKQLAPAAVVGLLMKQQTFAQKFFNLSEKCHSGENCKVDCRQDDVECYLLDNNGFVIASKDEVYKNRSRNVGKFFGEIDAQSFQMLVDKKVYKEIKMYDYQAICIELIKRSGPGLRLQSPLNLVGRAMVWFWSKLSLVLFELYFGHYDHITKADNYYRTSDSSDNNEAVYDYSPYPNEAQGRRMPPNKTRPFPCDKQFFIYEMEYSISEQPMSGSFEKCEDCEAEYVVQPVPYTNLLTVVIRQDCGKSCVPESRKINPTKINYADDCRYETRRNNLERQRPDKKDCKNYNGEEKEIGQCGLGIKLAPTIHSPVAIIVITVLHLICIRHLLDIDLNKLMGN